MYDYGFDTDVTSVEGGAGGWHQPLKAHSHEYLLVLSNAAINCRRVAVECSRPDGQQVQQRRRAGNKSNSALTWS